MRLTPHLFQVLVLSLVAGSSACLRTAFDDVGPGPVGGDPCRDVTCSNHGVCGLDQGAARCWCDIGYRPYNETQCVVEAGMPSNCTQAADCDDLEECTLESCDPDSTCRWVSAVGACDDGDATTNPDECVAGFCIGTPGVPTPWAYGSSTVIASATNAPADGNAYVTVIATVRGQDGRPPVVPLRVEIHATGGPTLSGDGGCWQPSASCVLATNAGQGAFVVTASTRTTGPVTFSAQIVGETTIDLTGQPIVTFDTSLFTVITADTTITSADSGESFYFTGGTATFDESTRGDDFGDLFINGGTVRHEAATTTAVRMLDIQAASLNLLSGKIEVSGLGYPGYWSYGAAAPSQALRGNGDLTGGSHGGYGGYRTSPTELGTTYGDYRDPKTPGAGGEGPAGGGVVHIKASGACVMNWPGVIHANGGDTSAGGSISLSCAAIAGTASAGAITANGGNANNYCGAGGGGRIALISAGDRLTFVGSFAYPMTSMEPLTQVVHVHGGQPLNGYGNGGAGTLYLASSESTHGDLVVSNLGITTVYNGGTTFLPSVVGVAAFQHAGGTNNLAVTVTTPAGYGAAWNNFFTGMTLRPDLTNNAGSPNNWLDDGLVTVESNDPTYFVMTSTFTAVAADAGFRSIDVLDHIMVTDGATLESAGDIYTLHGDLLAPDTETMVLKSGMIWNRGDAGFIYPTYTGHTDLEVSTGVMVTPATVLTGAMRVSGGSITFTNELTTSQIDVTLDGGLTVWGELTVTGDINIASTSTAALVVEQVVATNFSQSDGTVTHLPSNTATVHRLEMTLSGGMTLTGGRIEASGLGYPGYWSYGAAGPSQALRGNGDLTGGSHGGYGGYRSSPTELGATYGDFKNPNTAGAGGEGPTGGGIIRVEATGACRIDWPAVIRANGQDTSAGGSIRLACSSFLGTAAENSVTADGGNANPYCGAGGGGRIALISTGARSSFSGSFAYPSASLTMFQTVVHAHGGQGNGTYGQGGAGTIYLGSSDGTYGDLIVANTGIANLSNGGTTHLPSVAGTAAFAHSVGTDNLAVTVTSPAGYGAAWNNYFAGLTLRPDLGNTAGTPANWIDDGLVVVKSNDPTYFIMTANYPAVAAGVGFRSLDIVDRLEVTGGATLSSYGDIYTLHGSLVAPDTATLVVTDGMIWLQGGAGLTYPAYNGSTDVEITGGNLMTPGNALSGELRVLSGSVTFTGNLSTASVAITGDGSMRMWGDLSATGEISVDSTSTAALVAQKVTAADFILSKGTVSHHPTSTTAENRLEMTLSGGLTLLGGSIDVSSLGYPAWWGYSPTGPSQALRGNADLNGASHGGFGGYRGGTSELGPTYGNFKDPRTHGAGGEMATGGGVVRVTAGGVCQIDWPALIRSNGGDCSAGGSVRLACGGFAGTAAANSIVADGGNVSPYCAGGGGGRIALTSTGPRSSFTGAFAYPTTSLDAFTAAVHAHGGAGNGTFGNGGAGTLYLASSDGTYGDLIVSNKGVAPYWNGGTTFLPSIAGVAQAAHGDATTNLAVTVQSLTGYGAAWNNFFVGLTLRPDLGYDGGTPNDWMDDHVVTIATNDPTYFVTTAGFPAVAAGAPFRSIVPLDRLEVTDGATLETFSDIYTLHGSLLAPDTATMVIHDGMLWLRNNAALTYPTYGGATDLEVTAGTLITPGTNLTGALRVKGGSALFTGGLTIDELDVTTSGALTVWRALAVANDITINSDSAGALVAEQVSAANMVLTLGTVSHLSTNTAIEHRLDINLTGGLTATGGSINVSCLGYPPWWGFGPTAPSQGLRGNTDLSGGSHGGLGGYRTASNEAGPTYGDFRDPNTSGAGGEQMAGGGIARVQAVGACRIDWPAVIRANGCDCSAGGSILLSCGSLAGTVAANSITADGGNVSPYCAGGGGGRIALISSGARATFTDSFAHTGAALSTFETIVHARGGAGNTTFGQGGAGTLYLESSESVYGDLIVNNQGVTTYANGGTTLLRYSTANSNHLYSSNGGNSAIIQFAGTPLAGYDDFYMDLLIHVYPRAASLNPRDASHSAVILDLGNTNNMFRTSGNFPVIVDNYDYRFVYQLDRLEVSGTASVALDGADLILEQCDMHSADVTAFEVPSGSLVRGNSFASPSCMSSKLATQGGTIIFTNYFLQ